jgi:thiol-disulfide isomerase/thioredoxin
MLSRRSVLLAAFAASTTLVTLAAAAEIKPFDAAAAAEIKPFDPDSFAAAQQAGKPIFVAVHASWCPICKVQKPILSELTGDPKFKDLVFFVVDFDTQKDAVKQFGVRMQSTLIAFKGAAETGRSVGDRNRGSIAALLDKTL